MVSISCGSVLLLWIVLCCIATTLQSICTQEDNCVGSNHRDYCKEKNGLITKYLHKPLCPVMEVQLGIQKWIYIHCCDNQYNVTSRKWYFKQHINKNTSWELLDDNNETLPLKKLRSYRLGFYRCITKNGNTIIKNQTFQIVNIKCRQHFDKPEIKVPTNQYLKVNQHDVNFHFHVKFGCEARSRNINVYFHKDGNPRDTEMSNISIHGCASSGSPVSRSCGSNISIPVVTPAVLGMGVSITATACYGGEMKEMTRNFSIFNEMQYREVSNPDTTVTTILMIVTVTLVPLIIYLLFIWMKLDVTILSEMTFLMRINNNRKCTNGATKVHIAHYDEDVSTARQLQEWMENTYTPLQIVCSGDFTGGGVFTSEIKDIQESDVVLYIPNFTAADNVHENLFNSIVEHKRPFRITILEIPTQETKSCSLRNSTIFKRLKHVNLDKSRRNFPNELLKRLPACVLKEQNSVGSEREQNSDSDDITRNCEGYRLGYHLPCAYTYCFRSSHVHTCSRLQEESSNMICPETNQCDLSSATNSQKSNKSLPHFLKLNMAGGNHTYREITSPCIESPDTAST
ncbi:uncharacterized protein LOC132558739 [Ylistrum balloti]|uniref:uncharacterized protein LOC132558739 n=1 Tax=Ylistrum balloti TaxID=509963 RepID=UPI002905C5A4|nr:uncharacterized protein LOC132558739 [Ylistrum balloti]